MPLSHYNFGGDPNVGAFARSTNEFLIVPPTLPEQDVEILKEFFKIPVIETTIAKIEIVGIMVAANKNGILVPYTTTDDEIKTLKKSVGIPVERLESKMTALGNLIAVNDNGAYVSSHFDKDCVKVISDVFDVEVVQGTIASLHIVGSTTLVNNFGALVHPLAKEREIEKLNEILKVESEKGTLNRGIPYVGIGAIANDENVMIGEDTTGLEATTLVQTLGIE